MLQRLLEHKKEVLIAIHAKQPGNSRIRKLAVKQPRILEQRKKLDSTDQETVDVTTRLFAPR